MPSFEKPTLRMFKVFDLRKMSSIKGLVGTRRKSPLSCVLIIFDYLTPANWFFQMTLLTGIFRWGEPHLPTSTLHFKCILRFIHVPNPLFENQNRGFLIFLRSEMILHARYASPTKCLGIIKIV